MPLGIKPTVDFAFKKFFGSPENVAALIGLLNAILELRAPITDVEILNPFNYKEFEDDKQIVLDIRARDSTGRMLNIEMQVAAVSALAQRLVYYACSLYVDQLGAGDNYARLRPAISICLLDHVTFRDTPAPHHRFRLHDSRQDRELGDMVEVHTVELPKYDLREVMIREAPKIEQWVFLLLSANRYSAEQLRALLPGVEFDQAITVIETISQKTEDRTMYDQREKAMRDQRWLMEGALEKGREEGRQQGRQQGLEEGLEQGLEQGRLIGTISTLQGILSEAVSSESELEKLGRDELTRLCADLQARLRTRGDS